MRASRWGNIALGLVLLAVLYFVALQAQGLWQSFAISAPSGAPRGKPNIYLGMSPEQIGKLTLTTQGCLACHNVDLEGGVIGPSLDNLAIRRADPNWLKRQILTPHAVFPGSLMPIFPGLSQRELSGLIAYLHTLGPGRTSPDNQGQVQLSPPPGVSLKLVQQGTELFKSSSCVGCHTINGVSKGALGPNLTHEAARRRSDEWQLKHLKDPLSVYVWGQPAPGEVSSWLMPPDGGMRLSQAQLQALVAYMQSLK